MADAESIKRRLKEERIPKALWPRTGKIKPIFSAASPVPPGACPMGGCRVGLVRGGGTRGRRPP
jgi:hypothetical protein